MLQASNQCYDDSMLWIDIIIMFIYHTRTEQKLQTLNSVKENYGWLPEKLHVIELAAYANQTKLYNIICNNNRGKNTL